MEWHIKDLKHSREGTCSRITVNVGDHPLWFESPTHTLLPSVEAIATCMLVPALHQGARLILPDSGHVDEMWLGNIRHLPALFSKHWDYPDKLPWSAVPQPIPPSENVRGVAACFSGGIDSFFTLLTHVNEIDDLLFVEGFDVPLGCEERLESCRQSVRAVADHLGKRACLVRTNLRSHPLFDRVDWGRTFGSAMAAVGHLLAGHIRTLYIPSSYAKKFDQFCGSHWTADRFHSSSALQVEHDGEAFSRPEKTRFVAQQPIVQQQLRVCWENTASHWNCSRCEKCLRTRTHLLMLGVLDQFTVFDHSRPISEGLSELPYGPANDMAIVWVSAYRASQDPAFRRAIRDYILRPTRQSVQQPLPRLRKAPLAHLRFHADRWKRKWMYRQFLIPHQK